MGIDSGGSAILNIGEAGQTNTVNIGTGATDDMIISHTGSAGSITNEVGSLTLENNATASDIINILGNTDNTVSFLVQNSTPTTQFQVDGDGHILMPNLNTGSGNALAISSGEIVDSVSLRVYKKDETVASSEYGYNINSILELEPKFFTWKNDNVRDFGFIVEDAVDKDICQFLYYGPEGPKNYKDRALIAGTLSYLKEQSKVISNKDGKIGFFGQEPQERPDISIESADFVQNNGSNITSESTFDGYTLAQIVGALKKIGLLN